MLFMVIERFTDVNAVGERFRQNGRMLPEGVAYLASWVEPAGGRCFQIMQAAGRDMLDPWLRRWEDLVDFEVVAVVTSGDYWAAASARETTT
jgi:uncharacterized protein DUF3303